MTGSNDLLLPPMDFQFADIQHSQGADHLPFLAGFVSVGAAFRARRVDYVELMLVLQGRGRLALYGAQGQAEQALLPGCLLMFRSHDDTVLAKTGRALMTTIAFSFARADWETFAAFVGLGAGWRTSPQPPMVRLSSATELLRPFNEARRRRDDSPDRIDLLRFLVEAVPKLLSVGNGPEVPPGTPPWLAEAVVMMHDEENLRGGVPRLQQLCHVSGPYLSVSVRRHYGKTPTAMVGELRIRTAAVLLATTTATVTEIAGRCGFSSVAHFSNNFRRLEGTSPREYRLRSLGLG